jgi:hypothetical protein
MSDKTKTHFKGPGEWRSQAAQLEAERDSKVKGDAPIKGRAGESS